MKTLTTASLLNLILGVLRPWLSLTLVCAGFSMQAKFRETFWTADFLSTVSQQATTNIILAVGLTFVILTGGIDLSVGSVLALCGIALGTTVKTGPPAFLCYLMALPLAVLMAQIVMRLRLPTPKVQQASVAISAAITLLLGGLLIQRATTGGIQLEGALLAALAVGLSCGLLNGLLVTIGRVPAFVVTLGMYQAARSLTVYATDGNSVSGLPPRLSSLGQGMPLLLIALAVVLIGIVLLEKTRFGRYVRAIGGNEEAARLTGVQITQNKTMVYALSGLTAAIGAIVLTAKYQVADTGAGTGAELNAIAAAVIGGTSLSGGEGSIVGSLVGALTISVLNAGLVITQIVPDTLQGVVIGIVIVGTVMIDQYRKKN